MQLQIRYRYHYERCLCHVSEQAGASVALEGAVGCTVYVCLIISLIAARVCINRQIFSCCRGNEHYKNSWAKSGGLKDRRAPWSKKWGWLGPSGQIVYAYAGLPLFKQCEIPDNSMTFPWRFVALQPMLSVTHIMPVLVLLYVARVGMQQCTIRIQNENAQVQQSQEWMQICS